MRVATSSSEESPRLMAIFPVEEPLLGMLLFSNYPNLYPREWMPSKNLNKAKEAKKEEFFTQLQDMNNELDPYCERFRGKPV